MNGWRNIGPSIRLRKGALSEAPFFICPHGRRCGGTLLATTAVPCLFSVILTRCILTFRGALMRKSVTCLLFFIFAAACFAQQNSSSTHFDGNSWWAHVKFLADDSLEGRNTGS